MIPAQALRDLRITVDTLLSSLSEGSAGMGKLWGSDTDSIN
jgi:hypothetical protein